MELIKKLATELAQRDYNELFELLRGVTFVDAYNKLGGFNLEMDECACDGELIAIQIRFDYRFNHIEGTIFRTENGGCELGEGVAVWDSSYSSPIIQQLDLCYEKLNENNQLALETLENNQFVLETLESLKNDEAFVTMLDFGVIELRLETYRDMDAPNDFEQQEVYDNLNDAINFCKDKEFNVVCFVDGMECINILDL